MARTMTKLERAELLRPRVLDAVMDMGHGDVEKGIDRFVDHALWCAKRLEMRVWKPLGGSDGMKRSARWSLLTFLRMHEKKYAGWDTAHATNVHWIQDVWEVACDDWFRVKPVKVEGTDDGTAREMAEWGDTSPDALRVIVGVPDRKLSAHILDAHVSRDSDRMLALLAEMEEAGL